jgi:hypothetical protein
LCAQSQRIEFAKEAPELPHGAPQHDAHDNASSNNNNNNDRNQNQSRAGTADHRSRSNTADGKELGATGGLGGVEKEVLSKEEEDFLKLEAIFITELGLAKDQLPGFARPATAK